MKKLIVLILSMTILFALTCCKGTGSGKPDTPSPVAGQQDTTDITVPDEERKLPDEERKLSDDQAVAAIRNYCFINNPDLEGIVNEGVYPVYWCVDSGDEQQVSVLFRSYTGAQIRYYIDRVTGDAYVTESVPNIEPEEVRTEESLNVWDYYDEMQCP